MFNREAFWSDAEEWAVQLQEEVFLPPELNGMSPFLPAFNPTSMTMTTCDFPIAMIGLY